MPEGEAKSRCQSRPLAEARISGNASQWARSQASSAREIGDLGDRPAEPEAEVHGALRGEESRVPLEPSQDRRLAEAAGRHAQQRRRRGSKPEHVPAARPRGTRSPAQGQPAGATRRGASGLRSGRGSGLGASPASSRITFVPRPAKACEVRHDAEEELFGGHQPPQQGCELAERRDRLLAFRHADDGLGEVGPQAEGIEVRTGAGPGRGAPPRTPGGGTDCCPRGASRTARVAPERPFHATVSTFSGLSADAGMRRGQREAAGPAPSAPWAQGAAARRSSTPRGRPSRRLASAGQHLEDERRPVPIGQEARVRRAPSSEPAPAGRRSRPARPAGRPPRRP